MENSTSTQMADHVARLLFESKAVAVNVDRFFQFVSGLLSPLYIDNRVLISYPQARTVVVEYLIGVIERKIGESNLDGIAGTATAGIPWAAWIADHLDAPLIYVRPTPKERGKERQLEGVLKPGQRILVVEDLITTGLSSSNVAEVIRQEGGIVNDCVAIFSFGARSTVERFRLHQLTAWTLTDLWALVRIATSEKYLNDSEIETVKQWAKTTLDSF